jgi:hypothetical protein
MIIIYIFSLMLGYSFETAGPISSLTACFAVLDLSEIA